jgi:hypothetical protein
MVAAFNLDSFVYILFSKCTPSRRYMEHGFMYSRFLLIVHKLKVLLSLAFAAGVRMDMLVFDDLFTKIF